MTVTSDALFKALGDPVRLRIVEFIGASGEKCVCEIIPMAGKSQPNVSRHLKVLEQAGVLVMRKEGKKAYYRVRNEKVLEIIRRGREVTKGK
jgi:ArsR family transcriptional regulator